MKYTGKDMIWQHFYFTDCDIYTNFKELLSQYDVALYGCICALASFNTEQIKKRIQNGEFRHFFELQPKIKLLLTDFYDTKYEIAMSRLNAIRNDMIIDKYLYPRYDDLLMKIRVKAYNYYTSDILTLEEITHRSLMFCVPLCEIESELIRSIYENSIKREYILLIFGYIKNVCRLQNLSMPIGIIKLVILLYNEEILWTFTAQKLKQIHSDTKVVLGTQERLESDSHPL
eukprot:252457_1